MKRNATDQRQRLLTVSQTPAERCRCLLSGDLGRVVRPASELLIDHNRASKPPTRVTNANDLQGSRSET